ncbi:MAG: DnaB helicase C-terminal domain-containing protein [Alphaproteobacteria bacterium]|nr:DnaB helicase C-terminal domain-containing protein [Alphaproteobacteria bacterium]
MSSNKIKKFECNFEYILDKTIEEVADKVSNPNKIEYPTYLEDLDDCIGGIKTKQVYLLGGVAGAAKVALAMNLCLNLAKAGLRVNFYSFDWSNNDFGRMALSHEARVSAVDMKSGKLSRDDIDKLTTTVPKLCMKNLPIYFSEKIPSINDLKLELEELKKEKNLPKLIIINTIQDMEGDIYSNIHELKYIAREYDINIICTSYIDKEKLENRLNKVPELEDISSIEHAERYFDVVMLLDRKSMWKNPMGQPLKNFFEVVVNVCVNKNGKTEIIKLAFDPLHLTFGDYLDGFDNEKDD